MCYKAEEKIAWEELINSGRNLLAEYDANHDSATLQEAVECFRTATMLEMDNCAESVVIELSGILLHQFEQGESHRDKRLIDFRTLDATSHEMNTGIGTDMHQLRTIMNECEPRARRPFP